ncbi:MAG: response regulator transcription factor [Agathobacter sp.]|nr:response regulator transcription factor [Agathobacter sp.]MBQ2283848.1 response regulator transcription factor [Agathobacter sp.]
MTNILLVEDDPGIVANLTEFLKREGFSITAVNGQTKAMELLMEENVPFDLLLLDVSLSDGNGFSICAAVKAKMSIPVIFLTASGDEYSVVTGLDLGADDYIPKPFRPRELISRINSVLRRYGTKPVLFSYEGLTLDPGKAQVHKNGQELFLSALEYRLLLFFFQNRGTVLSRTRILEELWDLAGEFVNDNTLTVYIKRLREKIEDDPANPVYIQTLRGIGYKMGK